jgi:hypothetical protein
MFDSNARTRNRLVCAATAAWICLSWTPAAHAQGSRHDEHERKQIEKAALVAPSQKNLGEKLFDRLEDWGFLAGAPNGIYPWAGSVYKGGGLAVGAGLRRSFRDTGAVNVLAGWSIRNYKLAALNLHLPELADRRIAVDLTGAWTDAPQVRYFGMGESSLSTTRTAYGFEQRSAGLAARVKPAKWLQIGGGAEHLDITTGSGVGRRVRSIETIFTAATAPGLGTSPTYLRSRAFAIVDWRKKPGYTGSGGLYRLEATDYSVRTGGDLNFRQYEGEVVQLIPVLAANWVIALRGLVTTTETPNGNIVPFYLAPSLGGSTTLRGYPDFRFRGNHRLVANAEYRWTPARFMDMAIFYDAGKVTEQRSELDFQNLKTSYGIGARFHSQRGTVMQWEVARSREHAFRFLWSFGAAF